ncbi:MAG TPA: chemotaxis protein CheA [Acidocella sp.]|nr:chemotaxis protein CheA [Acidocella sp.]
MAAIKQTFFQECEEQLAELEAGLTSMDGGAADSETVNAVFRAVHSIKGSAGIFALDKLVKFAHVFETTLDAVRSGRLNATPEVIKVLLQASDTLSDVVRAARGEAPADEEKTQKVVAALTHLISPGATQTAAASAAKAEPAAAPAAPPAEKIWVISFRPHAELYANANEALPLLRELARLGRTEVSLDDSTLPALTELDPEGAYLAWTVTLHAACDEAAIRDVFEFVEDECVLEISAPATAEVGDGFELGEGFEFEIYAPGGEGIDFEIYAPGTEDAAPAVEAAHVEQAAAGPVEAMAAKAEAGAPVSATIRVDLDRVDRLINLVGELVINEGMLSQRVLEAGITRASGVAMALEELEHLTREIQDSVMAIRAQPVRSVFMRMPRLVREVADQTGKQVRLLTEGEGTEVDKTVIERIADPLTHMIRNAIDHGLESPEGRTAAGKPLEGTVKLSAAHRSGRIVLEVSDDGGGINRSRVKQKAIDNGLIAADAQLTDNEIDNLIFLPGFSTAQTISNISGRGVGMDVVRQSVQALGGRISITSIPGAGSTFSLSLPLTLAVLDGMVVRVGRHTLIVPLGTVIETLKPKAENVHALDSQLRVLSLRGGYIPLIDVAEVLGYSEAPIDMAKAVALLVEGEGGRRVVLLVDAIDGQRQVVIKSLEANYRAVPGIAAATVMGDGRVALILDIDTIVSVTRTEAGRLTDGETTETSSKNEMTYV